MYKYVTYNIIGRIKRMKEEGGRRKRL